MQMTSFPIRIPIERYHFVIRGKPWVQKNDLIICYKNRAKKTGVFIGHSTAMSHARDGISTTLYTQFQRQGGRKPITYPVRVDFIFYVKKAHEPDLDNLLAIVCDAMQGIVVKGVKGRRVASILTDDKLIKYGINQKITEGDINYVGEPRTELVLSRWIGGLK